MEQVNERLWKHLEESGFRRAFVAEKCGISPRVLGDILRGRKSPTPEMKTTLAEILEKKVSDLFLENDGGDQIA